MRKSLKKRILIASAVIFTLALGFNSYAEGTAYINIKNMSPVTIKLVEGGHDHGDGIRDLTLLPGESKYYRSETGAKYILQGIDIYDAEKGTKISKVYYNTVFNAKSKKITRSKIIVLYLYGVVSESINDLYHIDYSGDRYRDLEFTDIAFGNQMINKDFSIGYEQLFTSYKNHSTGGTICIKSNVACFPDNITFNPGGVPSSLSIKMTNNTDHTLSNLQAKFSGNDELLEIQDNNLEPGKSTNIFLMSIMIWSKSHKGYFTIDITADNKKIGRIPVYMQGEGIGKKL